MAIFILAPIILGAVICLAAQFISGELEAPDDDRTE